MSELSKRNRQVHWPAALCRVLALILGTGILAIEARSFARTQEPLAVFAASDAGQVIKEASDAATTKMEEVWKKIDERRLKNRTRDELVAWAIMGLLTGGLLHRFSKCNQLVSVLLGLVGAFLGGIVAHVTQLNLGLGPVLITYEDLLCTLAGGVLILCGARWSTIIKLVRPRKPQA